MIQPSKVHTGLTSDPPATLEHLFQTLVVSSSISQPGRARRFPGMTFKLIDSEGQSYESRDARHARRPPRQPRLRQRSTARAPQRWIAKGHYVSQRVFFADEETAIAAGYRPCANCMPASYARWTAAARRCSASTTRRSGRCSSAVTRTRSPGSASSAAACRPSGCGTTRASTRERTQLDEYFAGERESFDFPMRLEGAQFDRLVWRAARGDPVRDDHDLRRDRRADRQAGPRAGGRRRERAQPDRDRGALPPRDRSRRQAHRLRRRARAQARAARPRGRAARRVAWRRARRRARPHSP